MWRTIKNSKRNQVINKIFYNQTPSWGYLPCAQQNPNIHCHTTHQYWKEKVTLNTKHAGSIGFYKYILIFIDVCPEQLFSCSNLPYAIWCLSNLWLFLISDQWITSIHYSFGQYCNLIFIIQNRFGIAILRRNESLGSYYFWKYYSLQQT